MTNTVQLSIAHTPTLSGTIAYISSQTDRSSACTSNRRQYKIKSNKIFLKFISIRHLSRKQPTILRAAVRSAKMAFNNIYVKNTVLNAVVTLTMTSDVEKFIIKCSHVNFLSHTSQCQQIMTKVMRRSIFTGCDKVGAEFERTHLVWICLPRRRLQCMLSRRLHYSLHCDS